MLTPPGYPSSSERDFPDVVSRVFTGPRRAFASPNMANNRDSRELVREVISSTTVWTAPLTFGGMVSMSGLGGKGYPESTDYVQMYQRTAQTTQYPASGGSYLNNPSTSDHYGPTPTSYCDPYYPPIGTTNGNQTCYSFSNTSYYADSPAYYGGSSLAFGKEFYGGYGSWPESQSADVSTVIIVPGESYIITIGGTGGNGNIIMEYYK